MQLTLQGCGFEVIPQNRFAIPPAVEDGLSFVENALIKARHACRLTGLAAIADDSGLEVNALHGEPGIYSSRYALDTSTFGVGDKANNQQLLHKLKGIKQRDARFVCVIAYMRHAEDPTPILCQASWEGHITQSEIGDNGFGYDPLFYVPEFNCHAAELPAKIKQQISHRAKALAQLKHHLDRQS